MMAVVDEVTALADELVYGTVHTECRLRLILALRATALICCTAAP